MNAEASTGWFVKRVYMTPEGTRYLSWMWGDGPGSPSWARQEVLPEELPFWAYRNTGNGEELRCFKTKTRARFWIFPYPGRIEVEGATIWKNQ